MAVYAALPVVRTMLIEVQILQISIYLDMNDISTMSFGRRSTAYPGTPNFQEILTEELKDHKGGYNEIWSEGGPKAFVDRTIDHAVPVVDHGGRSIELKSSSLLSQPPCSTQSSAIGSGTLNRRQGLSLKNADQSV